ncbi:MAG: hypothetical protein O2887_10405 [Bacteroidetes bacterium]|nr:hypothetical protein [Bacteroidota bacterium]
MDIIYNIQQTGVNKILLNETTGNTSPVFNCLFGNPWTQETKTAQITPEGLDGEWILNFEGVTQPYEDLSAGLIEFENIGTWNCSILLSVTLIRDIRLQVT